MSQFSLPEFSQSLLNWFDTCGRHDLPWQQAINPYRVWVSEIMLQQTQVKTVIPYYERFMQSFPSVTDLAAASQEEVLSHWAGLGYYARGRNLHQAAQMIVDDHGGQFPNEFDSIVALPGIGRSTAGAILSIALQQRFAILDGNVKRVLSRYFAIEGWPGEKAVENQLWQLADTLTPKTRFNDYTQAIMDLGATLCTRSKPNCDVCPVNKGCLAFKQSQVDVFPFKKPKKDKPTKQAWLLIRKNAQDEIWLEQRPQKGIWGGLWSFPEFESHQACLDFLQQQVNAEDVGQTQRSHPQSLLEWDSFRHTFSHYHLEIHPLLLEESCFLGVNERPEDYAVGTTEQRASAAWHKLQAIVDGQLGVPAPVTKLLEKLVTP
ncbi:A/G-specific adenine glycosylase [Thiomicrorhabdus immobilis]|uniref:Adenine DNA glycosylase n=1 Tax=Thiomicrorhabdus immobilis TaxID=2791037 RepID=A0ABM7MFP1_9GAMM|nr:A/G-specific adenine glycosylase [Thiomicrorhabdus immobilis]BCN94288.1 A/G-specific adenine glycosylase [Thiomicrorhabdus immobilis]